jgi:site-specific DNA recombinase
MKTADLYIRVSTDEQADKGYSQRSQNEVLRKYCDQNRISIRKTIYEDHSAKTFIRPEWQKLLVDLKKHKHRPELILFTKWDRFSRNAPDAYQMIATLKNLGIEPQAIEQPLDTSIPENKMMLAIYLTAPEIENDRRALNVFYGMRRARKEGRWMAGAPIGYINKTAENGTKYIAPKEPHASIMKWAFKEIATGKFSTEQIYKKAKEKGLGCSKNRFLVTIRNPVYCGLIFVPKFKDEDDYIVKGIHEPLITQSLFYEAQDILSGKKKAIKTKIMAPDRLPLRGFILCSKCTRTLCGSASKGRNAYYHYYHCCSACGCRHKADEVNKSFTRELGTYLVNPKYEELYKQVILDKYLNVSKDSEGEKSGYIKQITSEHNRITKARELLLSDIIDGTDFKAVKTEAEHNIAVLEAKMNDLENTSYINVGAVELLIEEAIKVLTRIDLIFSKTLISKQRALIGSMFPEKFSFETLKARTAKLSETYSDIYLINKKLRSKKNGINEFEIHLPRLVGHDGLEPSTKRL